MGMKRALLGSTAAIVVGALVLGCLEFDGQTVYLEYDKANDRLAFIINYLGLYAGGSSESQPPTEKQLSESVTQLDQGVSTRTVALLSTFPFTFSIEDLRAKIERPENEWPDELRGDALALLGHARVLNGGFYTDEKGRLCGMQVVFCERASEAVPLANRVINGAILWARDLNELEDEVARAMVQRAQQRFEWIRLEGHSLVTHFAVAQSGLQEGREKMVSDLLGPLKEGRSGYLPELEALLASPVFVWHEDDLLRVRLGLVDRPSRLVTRPAQGYYAPNVMDHVAASYGLHLDEALARYLVTPDAPAASEEEEAARFIAPRLTQRERVRVLVSRLHAAPSDALRGLLRAEGVPPDSPAVLGIPSDESLLRHWERWLGQPQPETAGAEQPAPGSQP